MLGGEEVPEGGVSTHFGLCVCICIGSKQHSDDAAVTITHGSVQRGASALYNRQRIRGNHSRMGRKVKVKRQSDISSASNTLWACHWWLVPG